MKLSPDGKFLVTTSRDGTAILWDWKTGKEKKYVLNGYKSFVSRSTFSEDGKLIAAGGKEVRVWDVETGELVSSIDIQQQEIDQLKFVKNWLFVSDSKKVTVWNVKSGVLVAKLDNARAPIAFSPDRKILATRGTKNDVLLWGLDY